MKFEKKESFMMFQQINNYYQKHKIENRDLVILLLIGGLYSGGIFLSNTFVNVYIWKQSGELITIANYNLASYIFQALAFVWAGKLSKAIDRILILRVGILFLCLFFVCVLFIGELAAYYNFILGCLIGIGYGFFWLAFHVMTFEITEPDTRDMFNGVFGILSSFAGMVGPLLAGFIIANMVDDVGYNVIFGISFLLFACAVIASFFIVRKGSKGLFAIKHIAKERKRNKNWKRVLHSHFFQGLREGIFGFYITIWVFLVTNSELALGTFNMFLSGLSIVFYLIAAKYIKPHLRKKSILVGGLLLFASIFIIIFEVNYTLLMVYAVVIGVAYPILNVPFVSMTFDVIGKAYKAAEMRVEYIVIREIFLNLGRALSITVFILGIIFFEEEQIIPTLLIVFGAGHLVIYFLIKNIHIGTKKPKEILIKEQITDEKKR
nr:MFS transporter [Oceanobacillus kimchii]